MSVVKKRRKAVADWVAQRNATTADAAVEFGISEATVETACKLNCVEPAKSPRACKKLPTDSTFQILKQIVDGDKSLSEIARNANVSRQRVDQIKNKAIEAGFQLNLINKD